MASAYRASQEVRPLFLKFLLIITPMCFIFYFLLYESQTSKANIQQKALISVMAAQHYDDEEYSRGDSLFDLDVEESFERRPETSLYEPFAKLDLVQIRDFYIDPNNSGVFFASEQKFVLNTLFLTRFEHDKTLNLKIRTNATKPAFYQPINPRGTVLYRNGYYSSHMVTIQLKDLNISDESDGSIWYSFEVNNTFVEFKARIVNKDHVTKPDMRRTARLIKCIWFPGDVRTFEYVMKLIVESRYDSIYVCLFASDEKLKSLVRNLNSTSRNIYTIELVKLPNFKSAGNYLSSFDEGFRIEKHNGELYDPAHEFLLNLMYPMLVSRYRYVHGVDYDHIVFAAPNQTFYERVRAIVERNKAPNDSSLYVNQYWALENELSVGILGMLGEYLRGKSVDVDKVSESELKSILLKIKYPLVFDTPGGKFQLRVDTNVHMLYGLYMFKYLREARSDSDQMFRHVILKFKHQYIYGQMIHNTKSSMEIKLCQAAEFFRYGQTVDVVWPHSIHYRDTYNFDLIKVESKYIPLSSFVLWKDLDK